MTDLRKAAEDLLEGVEVAIKAGDWKVDGACDPDSAIVRLRQALAQPEQEPKRWAVFCRSCRKAWSVSYPHPGESICKDCDDKLAGPVDAVNISQERVDETAKGEHEPWPSVRCVCGGTIYFKYTPPVSDYHEGWEEGFKAGKREWVGLTDDEIIKCFDSVAFGQVEDDLIINKHVNIFRAIHYIEAKLKEKNT